MTEPKIKFGSIFEACLTGKDSVQGGYRPVLIVQNDIGNRFAPTVTIIPITSKAKNNLPTHVNITPTMDNGLTERSTVLCEQVQTISKGQISGYIGKLSDEDMNSVGKAIAIQMPFNITIEPIPF